MLQYESANHTSSERQLEDFMGLLFEGPQVSLWPEAVWKRLSHTRPLVLGVDSLTADAFDEFEISDEILESEMLEAADSSGIEFFDAAVAWLSLPGSIKELNGRHQIVQIHGDIFPENYTHGYGALQTAALSTLPNSLMFTVPYAGIRLGLNEHKMRQKYPASYDWSPKMRSLNRREFIKSLGGTVFNGFLAYCLLANASVLAQNYLDDGIVQNAGEEIMDRQPFTLLTRRDEVFGRSALVATKTEEAGQLLYDQEAHTAVLFGTAHTYGREVVQNTAKRARAVRGLADIIYPEVKTLDYAEKHGMTQRDAAVARLADTKALLITDFPEIPTLHDYWRALPRTIAGNKRYYSEAVQDQLDGWKS